MANTTTLRSTARVGDNPATRRFQELAAQEGAAAKERLRTRIAAARSFSGAVVRLVEAKVAWERAQTEAECSKAKAVGDLLGTGLRTGEVADLLGISEKELRSLRAMAPERPANVKDAENGVARQAAAMRTAC